MTQTITSTDRPQPPGSEADIPSQPTDILMHLIVAFLAPMFLSVSNGNITFARMAAIETVNAYRGKNHSDLIAIAQIIAFGLTALGSLSLSMADNLSLSMTLRLRTNANALNRSAQQNRHALAQSHHDAAATFQEDPAEALHQATVMPASPKPNARPPRSRLACAVLPKRPPRRQRLPPRQSSLLRRRQSLPR